jgi:TolB-like protein
MKRLLSALLLLLVIQSPLFAASESEVTIPEAIRQFAENRKKVRIAVFDFANTDEKKTRYDTYIADMFLSELSKYQMTLLERKRLQVLLGEHALSQSGVIDQEKAQKLGEMLPVDLILSGSYTEFPGKVVIHGRFIHVGTGEIVSAFTSSFQVAPEQQKDQATVAPLKKVCPLTKEEVQKLLYTLNTPKAIAKVVDQVIRIPFDTDCGAIHFEVMASFMRNKIRDDLYKAFLLKTITNIETPSADYRAPDIIRFFAADKVIDKEEWEAGLTALKRMQIGKTSSAISNLLNSANEKGETVQERADTIMRLTAEGKVGRPVPAKQETMFFALLYGMGAHSGRVEARSSLAFFRAYNNVVPDNDTKNKEATSILRQIYANTNGREAKREAAALLIQFYKERTATDPLAEDLADTIRALEAKGEDRYADKEVVVAAREDARSVTAALPELYCKAIEHAKQQRYQDIVEERSLLALKYGMRCNEVPTVKDLEAEMRSGDWERKLKAVDLLVKIGEGAKEAEQTVTRYLGQQGFDEKGGELRKKCAMVLGNIRSRNPEGIKLLIAQLAENDLYGVYYEALEALKKIGNDALPFLVQGLGSKERLVRLRCVTAIGELRKNAQKALPKLKQLAARDKDDYVRKEAAGAILMITNDF